MEHKQHRGMNYKERNKGKRKEENYTEKDVPLFTRN
jgi:hypothetical protein